MEQLQKARTFYMKSNKHKAPPLTLNFSSELSYTWFTEVTACCTTAHHCVNAPLWRRSRNLFCLAFDPGVGVLPLGESCRVPREISRSPRLAHKAPVMQAIPYKTGGVHFVPFRGFEFVDCYRLGSLPRRRFYGARFSSLEEGWKTSSPKNACVGGYCLGC